MGPSCQGFLETRHGCAPGRAASDSVLREIVESAGPLFSSGKEYALEAPALNDLADVYEAMIDWPKRLAREGPFLRRLVDRVGARRALDCACGTGHHAAMLHQWGLEVEGADLSPAMIERARAAHGQPLGLRWVVRPFDVPSPAEELFDLVLCLGNALALASDPAGVERAMAAMLSVLRPEGVLAVQVLNLWAMPDGPCAWQKSFRAQLPRGDVAVAKGIHRAGARGFVDLVVIHLDRNAARETESFPFLGLEADELSAMARRSGARDATLWGGYANQPYDRATSPDLVALFERT